MSLKKKLNLRNLGYSMIKVKKRKILLLPGDGIGPEVIAEVKKIINWLNKYRSLDFEIDEDLDCIVCYEPMGLNGASIYQCIEGHLICPKCYDSVRICPICRKPYERPPIRNRFAENFAKYNKCQTE